jgi:hypothetical protein
MIFENYFISQIELDIKYGMELDKLIISQNSCGNINCSI